MRDQGAGDSRKENERGEAGRGGRPIDRTEELYIMGERETYRERKSKSLRDREREPEI